MTLVIYSVFMAYCYGQLVLSCVVTIAGAIILVPLLERIERTKT